MSAAHARLEALFHRARALEGEARRSLLAHEVGDDPSLRRELEALLSACEGATARIEDALDGARRLASETVVPETVSPAMPERIGPYQLEEEIGRGGLAIVYRGRRVEPDMPQRVAIKIARFATDAAIAARAQQEQWILARLEHPNIARFLDGGRLDDGRFFLIMEYVEGRPIDKACRAARRSIDERVALLVTVAKAVQFAHQNLVLHRDLKPDNILVDTHGNVKLLDFGIAKILDDAQSPVDSPVTRRDERWLTPAYASPEQLAGHELTTASDVYSLGVVLHRLLTGENVDASSKSGEHIAPGVRLRDMAVRKATGIPSRDSGLGRDLDLVVAKALHTDSERRYSSPQAFADDLERILDRRPVQARPDRIGYRMRRFISRHRAAVAAVAMVVASLVTGLGIAIQQAQLARRAEAQAFELVGLMPELMIGADPRELPGAEISLDEALTLSIERFQKDPPGDSVVEAAALEGFGSVLLARGRQQEAFELLKRSLELLDRPSRNATLYGRVSNRLGEAFAEVGHFADAEGHYRTALEIRLEEHGRDSLEVAESANDLATALYELGALEEAEHWLGIARATRERKLGPDHPEVAMVISNMGALYVKREHFARAAEAFRSAVEISKSALGTDHPSVATNLNNLGFAYYQIGHLEKAVEAFGDSLAIRQRTLPEGHPRIAESEQNLEAVKQLLADQAAQH